MITIDVASCQDELERLCARVALLREAVLPSFESAAEPPTGATLWSSSYARLLLWPVASSDPEAIARAADEGEGWLDAALAKAERRPGTPLDGYLVLALPNAPALVASDEIIRRIELSARICRKHLVWPSPSDTIAAGADRWMRVADVTVLGLPDAVTAAGDALYWPAIDAEAAALWRDLQAGGVSATAQADEEGPMGGVSAA